MGEGWASVRILPVDILHVYGASRLCLLGCQGKRLLKLAYGWSRAFELSSMLGAMVVQW